MRCACEFTPLLSSKKSMLYFATDIHEMQSKLISFLEGKNIQSSISNGILQIDSIVPYEFFHRYEEEISLLFNHMQMQRIRVHMHEKSEPFKVEALIFAKTLDYYINLTKDSSFFDVLAEQSVTSHFQPIIDADTKRIVAHEALIRGVNYDGSLIYPAEMFEAAYRNDLIFNLDRLGRESALKTAAVKNLKTKIFINFIPTAIYDPKYCLRSTVKWAKQLDFDPSQIVFEVVETEKVKDQNHLSDILKYYREQGFQFALDDVGEGYSSLNMLIKLLPDIIKVDRNIITEIEQSPMKQSIYNSLLDIARSNDIKILAEGVETQSEHDYLTETGVDMMQGYFYGKPTAEPLRRLSTTDFSKENLC